MKVPENSTAVELGTSVEGVGCQKERRACKSPNFPAAHRILAPHRVEAALRYLARFRIERHCLEHLLVNIESCVQHLPGPPFWMKLGREANAAAGGPLHHIPTGGDTRSYDVPK
jgi:hypothetical protein